MKSRFFLLIIMMLGVSAVAQTTMFETTKGIDSILWSPTSNIFNIEGLDVLPATIFEMVQGVSNTSSTEELSNVKELPEGQNAMPVYAAISNDKMLTSEPDEVFKEYLLIYDGLKKRPKE